MGITLMICGAYWVTTSLICRTKNFGSTMVFKVLPFFTGLATMICAIKLLGW